MRSPLPDDLATIVTWPRLKRYCYFFEEAVETNQIWTLYRGSWAIEQSNGYQTFPLWPNGAFATICAIKQWQYFKPIQFTIEIVLNEVIPMLDNSLWFPSIFQTPSDRGTIINTQLLKDELLGLM
ncbi:DUF2750 domain-containing protein [Endozoicomonas sp. SM1973]|uniref:DUF2750 domain-containing protein n=1 Tax=Spartinivicinus marinus TaxID=2994442 RepID=A0A853INH9_9GAMM|nr:DUF2750 domain-containing protein [Spartinivicinus marinus]MCX4030395.1 DUF2750 domain-containing protein [Spartinivicinus marinus]MCX4030438.1 DUF2750 domain-containing protein [Spartinivicinus marinus]NYZ69396.1 DUF2750 domain-containing protein [Spartinivicinus marinus]